MIRSKLITKSEKSIIIEEYLNSIISSREVAKKYGISQSTVMEWTKVEREAMRKMKLKKDRIVENIEKDLSIEDPINEIRRLRKALEEAELEREFYKEIINIAERDLGINFKKNSGRKL
ncbi:MAG: hypothetical protein WAT92_07780 [Saprospiraceae bacterium]